MVSVSMYLDFREYNHFVSVIFMLMPVKSQVLCSFAWYWFTLHISVCECADVIERTLRANFIKIHLNS